MSHQSLDSIYSLVQPHQSSYSENGPTDDDIIS